MPLFCGGGSSDTEEEDSEVSSTSFVLEEGVVLDQAPVSEDRSHYFSYEGPGPWYGFLPNAEVPPRVAAAGIAGPDTAVTTLMALLKQAAERKGEHQALLVERPVPPIADKKVPPALPREEWTCWTYEAYHRDVCRAAKAFVALGMNMYESVNIWGFNAPEWHMSALAAMFAGGKSAGLYPTDTPETAAYKVVHSQGRIVVVEDRGKVERLAKALASRGDCRALRAFVAYGFKPEVNETVTITGVGPVPLLGWDDMLKLGDARGSDVAVDQRIAATKPGNCAALIYTSGTTGDPKAVMISHDNFVFEASVALDILGSSANVATSEEEERLLSYLPLSHVAGMMVDIVCPLVMSALKPCGGVAFFARPYDLKEKAIKDRLAVARPTLFLGVPLVWEKIADQIRAIAVQGSWVQSKVAGWAKGLGLQYAKCTQLGGSGVKPCGYGMADSLVLSKIKARLGLDQCKCGLTGAAPIRVDTLEFFASLGLQINEVYGMSECTGACTWSTEQAHQWGSVGWQLPGVEVKAFRVDEKNPKSKQECPRAPDLSCIDEEFQGELCFRGRNIMMGYLASPDMGQAHILDIHQKTAESIDSEGWLHSGDKGLITEKGMVKITGRYKELIIGEGGENIAPVPIEDQVKKACDGIAECMMIGDKRKFNVALVTLKAVGANGESPGTDQLDAGAKRVNPSVTTISQALDDKAWIEAVTAAIAAANKNGVCCPNNAFRIQKFCILPTNFSEEMGELTPTKKLKRKVVEARYAKLIDKIYACEGMYCRYSE